jgi:hypothetical protein
MSHQHDSDRLLRAFLDEGPDVLPDWIVDAVAEGIHRERQRAVRGSWRNRIMRSNLRTYLAAATVAAAVIAGTAIWASRTGTQVGDQPAPTPTPVAALLPSNAPLTAGNAYRTATFAEPLSFTVPAQLGAIIGYDEWNASTFRIRPFADAARAAAKGAITVHDGIDLPDNFCHPGGASAATGVADVRARIARSTGMTVSPEQTLTTAAGVPVSYWDVLMGSGCTEWLGTVIGLNAGEHHRIYAIQAPHGTIVAITWGSGYDGNGDDQLQWLNPAANDLVASLRFD